MNITFKFLISTVFKITKFYLTTTYKTLLMYTSNSVEILCIKDFE